MGQSPKATNVTKHHNEKDCRIKQNLAYYLPGIYLTAFLRVFPGVKPGARRAGSVIFSPVLGFRPGRSDLFLILNVPKPVITTFSPLFKESLIPFNIAVTESPAALFVRFAFFATTTIKSFLVKDNHPPYC